MSNGFQLIVHPIPGGKIVIHRYGIVFRVFLDCAEGLVEMPPCWVKTNYVVLRRASIASDRILNNCGLEVEVYG